MVSHAKNIDRPGVRNWLIQRFTACILALYTFFLMGYFIFHPNLDYIDWSSLFSAAWVRYFTLTALTALLWHAWLGIWTIATDYLKCAYVRLAFYGICIFLMSMYFFWGLEIIFKWSLLTWG